MLGLWLLDFSIIQIDTPTVTTWRTIFILGAITNPSYLWRTIFVKLSLNPNKVLCQQFPFSICLALSTTFQHARINLIARFWYWWVEGNDPASFCVFHAFSGTSNGLLENRAVNLGDLLKASLFCFVLVFWKYYLYHDLWFLCMNYIYNRIWTRCITEFGQVN